MRQGPGGWQAAAAKHRARFCRGSSWSGLTQRSNEVLVVPMTSGRRTELYTTQSAEDVESLLMCAGATCRLSRTHAGYGATGESKAAETLVRARRAIAGRVERCWQWAKGRCAGRGLPALLSGRRLLLLRHEMGARQQRTFRSQEPTGCGEGSVSRRAYVLTFGTL